MERVTDFILARPWGVIAGVLLATALLGFQLRTLRPEVSIRDLVPRDHPFTRIDDRLRVDFGAGQTNLIALRVASGDVFDVATLRKVQRLTDAVARLPGVEPSSVLSLTSPNVQAMRTGPDGVVEVGPLLETIPEDAAGLAALRRTVAAHPMFVGNLVTADGRGTLISADFAEPVPVEELTHALDALAAGERDERTRIDVGGQSAALAALQAATRGIAWPLLLALVVVGLVHYEAFRTPQAVVLPLATASLSVVWSLGLTSLVGVHVTPWTAITTILVLSVAAGHAVQILARYYECYAALGDTRAAVRASLNRVGPVMVTAGVVAAAGFASLATFGVPAVREFGLVAACGILSALLIELTFIPAVRSVLPPPRLSEGGAGQHRLLERAIETLGALVVARPRAVLAAVVAAVLLAGSGVASIRVNTAFRSWFSPDAPVIVADRAIREGVTGTSTLRLRIAAEGDATLLDPAALRGIAALENTLRADPAVSATLSIADPIRQLNRAMHDDDPAAYTVPDDAALVQQYMLLIDPERVARLLTPDQRTAALYALSRSDDVSWTESMLARLEGVAARETPPSVRVEIAGGELAQATANNRTVVHDKIENMLQVALVIFVLSAAVFRSLTAGLLVLAPLVCAVVVNLGVMGWAGTELSFATATYTSMGVSLGADFAIYLLFRLREELRERTLEDATRETLRTSGKAIFFVASAIAAGYATVLVSDFLLWRQLGAYVALMMVTSSLATLTVIPPLVLLLQPRFLRAEKAHSPVAARQPS